MSDPRAWIAAATCLVAVLAAFVLPPIALGLEGASEAADQREFHLPTIRRLAEQLPRPDLVDLDSATAPGYHLVMATVLRAGVESERGLRAISSLFSVAMLLVAWGVAARRAGPWPALALVGPLALSSYVLGAAAWMTTDNVALLFVLLAMAAGLLPTHRRTLAAAGLAGAAAVFVRQIHAWTAVVPMLGLLVAIALDRPRVRGWLGRTGTAADGRWLRPWSHWTGLERASVIAAAVLPLSVVGVLYSLWGGLVPPSLAEYHERGMRWTQPALTFALLGGFGLFFVPVFVRRGDLGARGPLIAAGVAAILAALPPTSYDVATGRWGGAIWELVRRLPAPADRSVVMIAGAALGAWVGGHAWRRLWASGNGQDALMLAAFVAGWTAAHCTNSQTWQRYAEPMILVWLAWAAAIVLRSAAGAAGESAGASGSASGTVPPTWWKGPVLLAAIQAGLLVVTFVRPLVQE